MSCNLLSLCYVCIHSGFFSRPVKPSSVLCAAGVVAIVGAVLFSDAAAARVRLLLDGTAARHGMLPHVALCAEAAFDQLECAHHRLVRLVAAIRAHPVAGPRCVQRLAVVIWSVSIVITLRKTITLAGLPWPSPSSSASTATVKHRAMTISATNL